MFTLIRVCDADLVFACILLYLEPADLCVVEQLSREWVSKLKECGQLYDSVWKSLTVADPASEGAAANSDPRWLTLHQSCLAVPMVRKGTWKSILQDLARTSNSNLKNLSHTGEYASSCDRTEQGVDQVLKDNNEFWSSTGSDDPLSNEVIVIGLRQPVCLVTGIGINVYQAIYQVGLPIYSPLEIRVSVSLTPFDHSREGVLENPPGTTVIGTFQVQKSEILQRFMWAPAVTVGGYVRLELIGRTQTQREDDKWYTVLRQVQVYGYTISSCESRYNASRVVQHVSPTLSADVSLVRNIQNLVHCCNSDCSALTSCPLNEAIVKSAIQIVPKSFGLSEDVVVEDEICCKVFSVLMYDLKSEMQAAEELSDMVVKLCNQLDAGKYNDVFEEVPALILDNRGEHVHLRPRALEWRTTGPCYEKLLQMAELNPVQLVSDVALGVIMAASHTWLRNQVRDHFHTTIFEEQPIQHSSLLDDELLRDEQVVRSIANTAKRNIDAYFDEHGEYSTEMEHILQNCKQLDPMVRYLQRLMMVSHAPLTAKESVAMTTRHLAYGNEFGNRLYFVSQLLTTDRFTASATLAEVISGPLAGTDRQNILFAKWHAARVYAAASVPEMMLRCLAEAGSVPSVIHSMNSFNMFTMDLVSMIIKALPSNSAAVQFASRLLLGEVDQADVGIITQPLLEMLGLLQGEVEPVRQIDGQGKVFKRLQSECNEEYVARLTAMLADLVVDEEIESD